MLTEKNDKKTILSENLFPVVGIGASAGGLDAFKKLLKAIPERSGMAYVLVQHLDPRHESMLPEILQKVTRIPVVEISEDIKVEPDHIYIIPSNKMLMASHGVLQLSPRPANKNHQNLPIDLFFTSLAEVYQTHAIGVVLSGTASDGTLGLTAIKEQGGITFAQDETSAQYGGMPHSAAQAGVVDFILPPEEIPGKLLEVMGYVNRGDNEASNFAAGDDEIFKQILALLRLRKSTDFTYYKQTTIRRRIIRRMAFHKHAAPAVYLKFLRKHTGEQDILYQDLLIPVTSFFRDRKSFDNLCQSILPAIAAKNTIEPIRIWVAGCSTGEEAFSIAICLKEYLNSQARQQQGSGSKLSNETRVQIFASDISEPVIAKARRGIYSKTDIEQVSPSRQQEFFVKMNGSYQVCKTIRDMCVFAVHNFLKDPPFAKMDLVSCRNVLIYMEPYLHKKALTTFHYALAPKGFLLLGKSETCGSVPELFGPYSKNDKLFLRKDVPGRYMQVASQRSDPNFAEPDSSTKNDGKLADFQKTADDILLSKFTPAGVVVNEVMEIVHFRGNTGAYLEPSPGKASFNLLKMIKECLAFEVRNILHKAKTYKEPAVKENIPVEINGVQRNVTIEAIPLRNVIEPHYLILFHESKVVPGTKIKTSSRSPKIKNDDKDLRILQLERELSQTREDMRAITEDQESANEELQSANEELLSGSEELQSLNEEMETSKEELQSTNEELVVINQEILSLNELITEARNYAEAIVTTIKEPLIILDKNLRVKSVNLSFYKTFMVNEAGTEGKLLFKLGAGQWDIPELRRRLENILSKKERFSDYEVQQVFPNIGERTMLLNAREMMEEGGSEKLILLAIEDITEKRIAGDKLLESEKKFRTMADFIPQIIWTAEPDGNLDYFNRQWYAFTGFSAEPQTKQNWISLLHEEDKERCMATWFECVKTGGPYQIEYRFKDKQTGNYRWFLAKAAPIKDTGGNTIKWFGSFTDIHQQKTFAAELWEAKEFAEQSAKTAQEAVKSKQQFLSNMSHEIRTPLNSIIGFTKVILKTPLSPKQQEYINAIKLSGDMMMVLINDILDIAKVDAGKMTFENVSFKLADSLSAMLHLFEIKLQEKKIKLVKQIDLLIPELLCGDPVRLHQVILNLVSNAVKFTTSGKISLDVHLLRETDDKVELEFSVADTGPGIAEDKLSLIFDNFQQAHTDTSGVFGGSGLGLYIVKKLIEAQGGTIHVKSTLNVGSVFTFTLWFQKTNAAPAPLMEKDEAPERSLDKIKILVVEDNPLNQLLMKTLLAEHGVNFEIAGSAKAAIDKLSDVTTMADRNFDIVLMDLQMPGMNGFDATKYIREVLKLDIPIIAVTASVTPENVQEAEKVGMNGYVAKPVDEKLLISKIISLLKLPPELIQNSLSVENIGEKGPGRYTDLTYLKLRTRSDAVLMNEMIEIYLDQTPRLIDAMVTAIDTKDWQLLNNAAHKLHTSFAIMGFNKQFENNSKKIQEYHGKPDGLNGIRDLVNNIKAACETAYLELRQETDDKK